MVLMYSMSRRFYSILKSPVPGSPEYVLGIINLRGEVNRTIQGTWQQKGQLYILLSINELMKGNAD